eukprot:TRINITY_DN12220_c0_g1_i1.p2 TRINITY_DN12220_c0_g1~~TRINITY_DN12220_c0_g1_i1.p2  ORF type:complete len:119 (-),score=5.93 TRINITY_DN12220_c0_g1_i1:63-419(-)
MLAPSSLSGAIQMKISTLSLSASALLLLLAALLASVVVWSNIQRQQIETQTSTLHGLEQTFLVKIRRELNAYPITGDANKLELAKNQLQRVVNQRILGTNHDSLVLQNKLTLFIDKLN